MHPYMLTRRQNLRTKKSIVPDQPLWVLLALDASRLTGELLALAFEHCSGQAKRVDILAANPSPDTLTLLLEFIRRLEGQGIEYRLVSSEGALGMLITRHLERHPGIKTVLTGQQGQWSDKQVHTMQRLLGEGHRIVCLAQEKAHVRQ
jgi:hypothetical protein